MLVVVVLFVVVDAVATIIVGYAKPIEKSILAVDIKTGIHATNAGSKSFFVKDAVQEFQDKIMINEFGGVL